MFGEVFAILAVGPENDLGVAAGMEGVAVFFGERLEVVDFAVVDEVEAIEVEGLVGGFAKVQDAEAGVR